MNNNQTLFDWSKQNTKQVRVSLESYQMLKELAQNHKSGKMMRVLNELVKKEYDNG